MILFTRADGTRTRCSGTLISPRVVLTAAHCTLGNDPNCKSSSYFYRTGIDDTRSFLDDFVPVP